MLNVVEIWNLKNELIKTLSHKISVTERNFAFRRKAMLKQCLKEVIYEYILAFAGWRFIFWEMVGSGGYILAGGGWWWMVVGDGGYILDGAGWWRVLVGHGSLI